MKQLMAQSEALIAALPRIKFVAPGGRWQNLWPNIHQLLPGKSTNALWPSCFNLKPAKVCMMTCGLRNIR